MTRRGWALFAAVAVLWGLPYLFIRVAVQAGLAPVVVVWLRTGVAALVLLPLALRRGSLRGLLGRRRAVLTLTLAQVTVPFLLIAVGEQDLPSSLAGLLVAAEPLLVVVLVTVLARARPGATAARERVDRTRLAGLGLGFAGVAALLGVDVRGSRAQLIGAALVLLATLSYAAGALLIGRITASAGADGGGADPVGVITAILGIDAVLLTPLALARFPGARPGPAVGASLAALALLCTAAAFVAYFALIAEVGPARATVVFYAAPVVTVAAGALGLHERLTAATVVGLALITAGSWLATRTQGRPCPPARDTGTSSPSVTSPG